MAMVSMNIPMEMQCVEDNPYGYGLRISLSEEQVEALGLESNPPAAGSQVGIRATARVVRLTQEADPSDEDKDVDVTLALQITDLEVIPNGVPNGPGFAQVLYGANNT